MRKKLGHLHVTIDRAKVEGRVFPGVDARLDALCEELLDLTGSAFFRRDQQWIFLFCPSTYSITDTGSRSE